MIRQALEHLSFGGDHRPWIRPPALRTGTHTRARGHRQGSSRVSKDIPGRTERLQLGGQVPPSGTPVGDLPSTHWKPSPKSRPAF